MPARHIMYKGGNLRLGKTEILRLIEHMVSLDQNNQGVNEMSKETLVKKIVSLTSTLIAAKDIKTADCANNSFTWQDFRTEINKLVDEYQPEPVKPVLSKEVADEMEVFRKSNKLGAYLNLVLNHIETAAYQWTNRDQDITDLVNAWNNGYTVEQVPRYVVYVPGTNNKFLYNKRGDSSTRAAKLETPIVPSPVTSYQTAYSQYKPLYWFTDEEINRFNLQDCEKELVTDDSEDY